MTSMERPTIVIDGKPGISGESVPGVLDRLAKRMVIALLKSIEIGQLTLEDNGERHAVRKAIGKISPPWGHHRSPSSFLPDSFMGGQHRRC